MNNKQLDVQVLPAFHLILDECRVVLKRGSPTPVGLRISDSRQASAALHNSPFHQSMDVLNRDRAACVLCISKENINTCFFLSSGSRPQFVNVSPRISATSLSIDLTGCGFGSGLYCWISETSPIQLSLHLLN